MGTGGPGPTAGPDFDFRPVGPGDLALLERWLAEPHVARWWPTTTDEFAAVMAGEDPTGVFVIEVDGRPAGLIQSYRLADEPEYARAVGVADAAGMDLLLGDPDLVGRGLGPAVIARFVEAQVWPAYPEVRRCMAGPSVANIRSQRAFEKAGFGRLGVVTVPGEPDDEVVMVLERPGTP